ncbi:MAG: hypothetical protein KC729_01385, partial [Candidatus Eisenbacteria bacterium]|nr:hypothetical protein [Candidatus Eisenbacteria bacterium]
FGNGRLRATYEPPSPGSDGNGGDVTGGSRNGGDDTGSTGNGSDGAGDDGNVEARTIDAGGSPYQDEVRIRVAPWPGLSGESIAAYPSFHFVDTYDTDDVMEAALDPTRSPERRGYECDVYVVEHKSPVAWGGNTDLIDATGVVETITLNAGSIADNRVAVWSGGLDAGPLVSNAYDIVYDFGRDGRLDPGDLIDGFDANRAGAFVVKDLNAPGPYAVSQGDYSAGTYLTQRTYYPSNLAQLGAVPLVTIGHGNGHQYTWYGYLGQHLASHGYVVMSYRNNTGPGIETASTTTLTNLDYLLTHLDSVLGGVLAGHLDTHRIGWIGHSRGGEGVVRAYDRIFDGAWSPQGYEIDDVRAVASIAPTVYLTAAESDPHDVSYYLIVGGADGDVTGRPDLPGDQYFRISDRSLGISQTSYVHGATHNDFNCCGFDDGIGPDQIGRPEAQRVAKSYFLALMQLYLDGNPATREFFTRMYDDLPPSGIAPEVEIATTFREVDQVGNFVIDDFQTQPALGTSSSNGTVTMTVANAHEGLNEDADVSYTWTPSDPMNGMIFYSGSGDFSRGLIFDHPTMETRWIEFEVVPAFRDVRDHRHLSLRACQGTRHPETVALDDAHSFAVTLRDENGVSSTVAFGSWGQLTPLYPRTGSGVGAGWVNEMNTVRISLAEFEADGSGIDLSRIAAVRIELGAPYGSPRGRIGLDDVMFTLD